MTKRREQQKIEEKKREWDRMLVPFDRFILVCKEIIKEEKDKMMYGKG